MSKHGRLIDADALGKDGWMMHRTVQVDSNTMEYQTKKPTDFLTIEPDSCEDAISRKAAIETILGQPTEAHYPEWYASQIKELPPAQPDCTDCKKHGGDWECDHMHCRKGRLLSVQPYTEDEIQKMQDLEQAELNKAFELGKQAAQLERKTGKWISHNIHYTFVTGETSSGGVRCSSCGFETHNKAHVTFGCPYNFCPNCGADMRGEQHESD